MPPAQQKLEEQKRLLRDLVERHDQAAVRTFFTGMHPADAASLVSQLLKREQKVLFTLLAASQAADVVEEMEPAEQVQVMSDLSPEKASDIVEEMQSDKGVDLLQDLPPEQSEALLKLMEPQEAAQARELLVYPEDCAGGLMGKGFISLEKDLTLKDAVAALQKRSKETDNLAISYLYALDDQQRLAGVLRVRDLVLKDGAQTVESFMIHDPVTVRATASLSEVQGLFEKYRLLALPVVDGAGRMLGLIQQADVTERMQREANVGLLKFTGIVGGEEYRDMPLERRIKHRLPWLIINIFLNFIAASVIACFQDTLQAVVAIAVFLPIVSDMSGCSGGQAVAVSIRELALGRLAMHRLLWVLRKELLVGFINGFVLGILLGIVAYVWRGLPYFGLVIAVALWLNTLFSVCVGGSLPLLLKKLDIDPAIAATPILTTLTDTMGFLLLMSLTQKFLPLMIP